MGTTTVDYLRPFNQFSHMKKLIGLIERNYLIKMACYYSNQL